MRTGLNPLLGSRVPPAPAAARERFRARFQRSLRACVRRHFSIGECFGVIWTETLEEIALTEAEEAELYKELIDWAKRCPFPELMHSSSLGLFIAERPAFGSRSSGETQVSAI